MSLLQEPNSKLKKAKDKGYLIQSFNLPAGESCPGAGECKAFCYAKSGFYRMTTVVNRYKENMTATKDLALFVAQMGLDLQTMINRAQKRSLTPVIRLHTSGDFYSPAYFKAWLGLMAAFPGLKFYAYTKSPFVRAMVKSGAIIIPTNFVLIYSLGSVADRRINQDTDRHAKIFDSAEALAIAGYDDASNDDTVAFLSPTGKIGLVIH
jgi:hypothetical protein